MKKIAKYLIIFSLVFGLSLSLTAAILTDSDGPATNVFTSSRGIDILLREPAWDGYEFGDPDWDNGLSTNPDYEGAAMLGYDVANEYLPGDTVPKDPTIKNLSTSEDAYVAMWLTYYVDLDPTDATPAAKVDYTTFATYLRDGSIVFDTGATLTDWTNESGAAMDFFVYNDYLEVSETTSPLFTEVLIDFGLVPNANGDLPTLEIVANAYAVQKQLPTTSTAALKAFAGY